MKKHNLNTVGLASVLAQIGILGVAAVSAVVTFTYFQSRGEMQFAWLSVFAECVVAGGLVTALRHWESRRAAAVIGVIVTLLAGLWSALTVSEKLTADTHTRSIEEAKRSPEYVQAAGDLATASALYASALAERVPDGLGPLTTEARSEAIERRAERLKVERDRAQARVESFTPPAPKFDAIAYARGFGVLLASILGLLVFGHGFRSKETEADKPTKTEAPEKAVEQPSPAPLTASELGKLGVEAKRRKREQAEQRRLAKNAYQREWRAKKSGRWPVDYFGEAERRPN